MSEGGDLTLDLTHLGLNVSTIFRNPAPAKLYEEALAHERGTAIAASGALIALSGPKTGRSPRDKRITEHPDSGDDIWWGSVNIRMPQSVFEVNKERAVDYLNTLERLFVIDGYAGWDPDYRLKIRVICERAYHALFMHNMLVRPSRDELRDFGEPDFVLYNAGRFPANSQTTGVTSKTAIDLSFEQREMVLLGTEYAGEMKKGLFTVMNYLMPKRGVLSMHCSATEGEDGDVTLFFGLSGTGKTTLSADPNRSLIGDDEHCWTDRGIFNIEGGCYAKVIDLSPEQEPEIHDAIRFGTVLENVVYDEATREVDFNDNSITNNTRASYPIEFVRNHKPIALGAHPSNIIFLTCDAFGILPPVSKLTPAQAMYHFINGYTAKIPGTEVGIEEPKATFSAGFGAPFLVWPPAKYAELLSRKMARHQTKAWLVNTGWSGGDYNTGRRIPLRHTRAILDAIHGGTLDNVPSREDPIFGMAVPTTCPKVPSELLWPRNAWQDPTAYDRGAKALAARFQENFESAGHDASSEIASAGPKT